MVTRRGRRLQSVTQSRPRRAHLFASQRFRCTQLTAGYVACVSSAMTMDDAPTSFRAGDRNTHTTACFQCACTSSRISRQPAGLGAQPGAQQFNVPPTFVSLRYDKEVSRREWNYAARQPYEGRHRAWHIDELGIGERNAKARSGSRQCQGPALDHQRGTRNASLKGRATCRRF